LDDRSICHLPFLDTTKARGILPLAFAFHLVGGYMPGIDGIIIIAFISPQTIPAPPVGLT